MVTELLGPSLEDLHNLCGKQFSLKTSLMIFYQMLERIEYLHEMNYMHRDIKPDNILMGLGQNSNTVYMIDFGLIRSVIDEATGQHISFAEDKNLVGTCRYTSVNSHLGYELSRRDDLIALGYVIIYLIKGQLPWQNIPLDKNSARYSSVGRIKSNHSHEKLCESLPLNFVRYMDYVRGLEFEQHADFNMLK